MDGDKKKDVAGLRGTTGDDRVPFLIWIAFCAVGNFVLGAMFADTGPGAESLRLFGVGFLAAEAPVLAIWTVLGPQSFSMRLWVATGVTLLLFGAGWAGASTHVWSPTDFMEAARTMLLCLPLFGLAIQSPLWVARTWFGLRLTNRSLDSPSPEPQRFSVKDLIIATGFVGAALAAARLAKPDTNMEMSEFLIPIIIAAAIVGVLSALITLPTVLGIHTAHTPLAGVCIAIGFHAVVYFGSIGVLAIYVGPPTAEIYAYFSASFISFVICLNIPMLILREMGYRLVAGRRGLDRMPLDGKTVVDAKTDAR